MSDRQFTVLAGKRAMYDASSKDYINWAESLLYEGVDSDNVAILASIGFEKNPDPVEVEEYFQKSLRDIGLVLPPKEEGLKSYAIAICEQIISGEIRPEESLSILERFDYESDYEVLYKIWYELAEDIYIINDIDQCIYNTGLTEKNKDHYIKKVAIQFIELIGTELPSHFFELFACPKCHYIGESRSEITEKPWMPEKLFRLIYNRYQARRMICSNCKRPFPNSMSDYYGRKQYLCNKN